MSLSLSVIICCYTQERLGDIREAAISVQRQTRPPDEIILAVDNNRALYDLLNAEFAGVARVILNESARGLSATRNAGVAAAQGDLVAFLDDDAVADPDWLLHLIGPFEENSAVVGAGGRAILYWVRARPLWFAEELDWTVGGSYRGMPERRSETRNPHGNNMCFPRSALLEVAGFEPAFGRVGQGGQAGEEAELSRSGARARSSPGSRGSMARSAGTPPSRTGSRGARLTRAEPVSGSGSRRGPHSKRDCAGRWIGTWRKVPRP